MSHLYCFMRIFFMLLLLPLTAAKDPVVKVFPKDHPCYS